MSSEAKVTEIEDSKALAVDEIATEPIEGQKPGTSGLRKKVKVFAEGYYLHNFVQAIFDAIPADERAGATLVVSGDGRYYSREAIQVIIKLAAAAGFARLWIGQGGMMSTPAVSAVIREREGGVCYGGIVLTASHNPGGPDEDFGIKFNVSNGGPAPDAVTDAIFGITKTLTKLRMCSAFPEIDIDTIGATKVKGEGGASFTVEVIDPAEDYIRLLASVFDLDALRHLIARRDFKFIYDGLSGVAGVYAKRVFCDLLGADTSVLRRCEPLPDFGGHHPDPNLVYAAELVKEMGLNKDGTANPDVEGGLAGVPDFGAAADGDADRNMILGKAFFVTPSDSVALIAANAEAIPFFAKAGGLKGVARSMPTSGALDSVAKDKGIPLFEVPTGWKYFGNLMDSAALYGKEDYTPFLCGEESFGTGSNHIREKDGMWAVLAWLSILAARNASTPVGSLVSVETIVREHWAKYGRNYYGRYDYEAVDAGHANELMDHLRGVADGARRVAAGHEDRKVGDLSIVKADEFTYTDPVDGSVAKQQGMRFNFDDGSRVVFRLSGTGSVGATIRMYLERLETDVAKQDKSNAEALGPVAELGIALSEMLAFTGRSEPSVIT